MKRKQKVVRGILVACAFVAGLYVSDRWLAASARRDGAPAASRPTTAPAVQAILDRVRNAYTASLPIQVEATLNGDFDVGGIVDRKQREIVATVLAPDRYRHEVTDTLVVIDDASQLHLFDQARNAFADVSHAQEGAEADGFRADARAILAEQNPAVFIATGGDPAVALGLDDATLTRLDPVQDEGRTVDRLQSRTQGGAIKTAYIDSGGLIVRIDYDFAEELKSRGAAEVKAASVRLRYAATRTGEAVQFDPARLAFKPPADATPLKRKTPRETELLTGVEPQSLVDKDAPPSELARLEGGEVNLEELKGSVVVLDFWATWCPPCRASLPHLVEAAKRFGPQGVKIYAVNLREDESTIRGFLQAQGEALDGLDVLLDPEGSVGEKYRVSGIPQTVVIRADGKISQVIVGFDPSDTKALTAAIEAAQNSP